MKLLRVPKLQALSFACAALLATGTTSTLFADPIPAGWACTGTCGSLGADGVVSLSPTGSSSYQYVSTAGSSATAALPTGALGSETNGSSLSTSVFSATAGTELNFYFNFVTSDGSGFADYAWAELYDATNSPVALLFTARTLPSGTIVPGSGLPAPAATLTPTSVPILGGGPAWSPLAGYSGACYNSGCGYTGWIGSNYIIPVGGDYFLKVGVTNWSDSIFDTGLAMDGVTVGGVPINPTDPPTVVPEPSTFVLLGSGLAGVLTTLKRRIRS